MQDVDFTVKMVKIPVSDIDRAIVYYRDVLGLQEEFSVPQYGWSQFAVGNLPLCLYVPGMGGGRGVAGNCDSIHLSTTALGSTYKELSARGAIMPDGLHTGDDGTKFVDVHDPDGNIIKIAQAS